MLNANASSDSMSLLNPTLREILEEFFSLQRFPRKGTIRRHENEINFMRSLTVLILTMWSCSSGE